MTKTIHVLIRLDNDLAKFISEYFLDDDEDLCDFVVACVEEKIQNLIENSHLFVEEFVSILSNVSQIEVINGDVHINESERDYGD